MNTKKTITILSIMASIMIVITVYSFYMAFDLIAKYNSTNAAEVMEIEQ